MIMRSTSAQSSNQLRVGLLRWRTIGVVAVLALLATLGVGPAAAVDPPETITAFTDESVADPRMLAVGPDGALWFPNRGNDSIGRITLEGEITSLANGEITSPTLVAPSTDRIWFANANDTIGWIAPDGTSSAVFSHEDIDEPVALTPGADDDLWFINQRSDNVGHITSDGVVTTISHTNFSFLSDLELGPDGNVWATSVYGPVGRITPEGVLTLFSAPMSPTSITTGPDGNLWLTGLGSRWGPDGIARMATDGTVVEFNHPGVWTTSAIVAGPDGALWFRNAGHPMGCFPSCPPAAIGRITTDGQITLFVDPLISIWDQFAFGADGNVWFSRPTSGSLGRLTPAGDVALYTGNLIVEPRGVIAAPDGNLWFIDTNDRIVRMSPVDPPGQPTAVTADPLDRSAAVSWDAPGSDGGSPIVGYTATADPGGNTCTTDGALTCTVTGLTNGTAYTVTVTATNAVATGQPSEPSEPVELPLLVPSAPTGVQAVADNAESTVTWEPPESDGGSPITGYTATADPGSNTCTTDGALTCTVTGLTNGTAYTFTVTATNIAGTSLPSTPSAAVTPRTVPGSPTAVVGTPGNTEVAVAWTAPASNGGSSVTGYTATGDPGGNTCTWTTGPLACTITGLTNGVPYTFAVTATNAAGTSLASTPSAPVTPSRCSAIVGVGPFTDVGSTHPFCSEIEWMSGTGVAGDYPDGSFRPTNAVSRQAMASFLFKYEGQPAVTLTQPFFADVPDTHPFYGAIQWMAESGLSTGSTNPAGGKPLFKPADSVSRQAMASFLWRNADEPASTLTSAFFADVSSAHPFYAPVQWMAETGLSTGTPNPPGKPLYKPTNPVSRQAIAAFLYRYDGL